MLLALPYSLVTGQHGLHRAFVFLSYGADLTQDEREAEEGTATSLISALSSVRALGSLTLATKTTRGPAGPLRDTWNWKVGVASSHHWVFQSQALAISTS